MAIKVLATRVRLIAMWEAALIWSLHKEIENGVLDAWHMSAIQLQQCLSITNSTSPEWLLICWFRCPVVANETPQSTQVFRDRAPSSCVFFFTMLLDNRDCRLLLFLRFTENNLTYSFLLRDAGNASTWQIKTERKTNSDTHSRVDHHPPRKRLISS